MSADKTDHTKVVLEHCAFPRERTNFTSIEELTLTQEQSLFKLVKRLSNNFEIPSFSPADLDSAIPQIKEALKYYSSTAWELYPELFFKIPEKPPLVCVSSPVSLSDGEVRDLTFKTRFETINPAYKQRSESFPRWRSVKAKHWMHTDKPPLGCVVAVHGWMLGDEKASALTLVPGFFYRMGLDVIVIELPMHASRSPQILTPLSMFPSLDPAVTNESFAQSVCELREISSWIKKELKCPVIGLGLSLGAQIVSIWASLDKLDAVICVAPLVSLPQFIWNQVSGTPLEHILNTSGLTLDLIEKGFATSNPLSYYLQTNKNNVFIIAGKNDSVVPAEHASLLWNHWDKPEIFWLEDGHLEQLITPGTGLEVHSFLHKLNLAEEQLRIVTKFREKR